MTSDPVILWSCDSYRMNAHGAVEEFARTYWDKPRPWRWLTPETFKMRDGARTYAVRLVGDAYHITALAT